MRAQNVNDKRTYSVRPSSKYETLFKIGVPWGIAELYSKHHIKSALSSRKDSRNILFCRDLSRCSKNEMAANRRISRAHKRTYSVRPDVFSEHFLRSSKSYSSANSFLTLAPSNFIPFRHSHQSNTILNHLKFTTQKTSSGEFMAKRFTDTTKWDDDWYLGLPPKIKCAWDYLCDNCDGCGVLKFSPSLVSFRIGDKVSKSELNEFLGDRIAWLSDDKLWVVDFIAFQYKTLSVKNHAHRGIMAKIIKLAEGLPLNDPQMTLIRGWKESLETLKDIGLGNRISKKLREESEESFLTPKEIVDQVSEIYKDYPRKEGKQTGLNTAKANILSQNDISNLKIAVDQYRAFCKRKARKGEFVLMFSTFMNQWTDWLDPKHGESEDFSLNTQSPDFSDVQWTGPGGAA